MRRGIFRKYLVSFASFFLVPMIVLSMCLHLVMYRNLNKEILTYNQNILERLGDDLLTLNGRLMEIGNRISFSAPVTLKSPGIDNQIKMIDMLRKENAENSYVTKAYFISRDSDTSYSSQGVYDKAMMLTKQLRIPEGEQEAFLEKLYATTKPEYNFIQKQYNQKAEPVFQKQVIFIYPVYNYSNRVDSWVVMELQQSKVNLELVTSSGEYSKGVAVLNQKGEELFSKGESMSWEKAMEEIQGARAQQCSVIDTGVNGQKLIIYPLGNPQLVLADWIVMPDLLGSVLGSNSLLIAGVLFFLLIGCIMAIYVAYSYYKPIHQLAQYMKKEDEPVTEKDELHYIKNQYDNVNSIKESLSREIENQWPLVEERLVTRILYDGVCGFSDGDIVGRVFEEQVNQQDHFVALIVKKNRSHHTFASVYKEKEEAMKAALREDYQINSTYIYEYEAIAVVAGGVGLNEESCRDVREKLEHIFGEEECIISLGNIYEKAAGIHVSFLEALTATRYRLLNPHKEFKLDEADQKDGSAYSQKISLYQTECLLSISRCLEAGEKEEVEKSVKEVVLNLEELPGQMALMCCYDIVSQLMKEVKKKNIHIQEAELFELTTFRTVEEFGGKLKEALLRIADDIKESKQNDQNVLAKQILDYIEDNFKDSSLCLVGMSEHFGYSSSYMSKFITQNLNRSFSELIAEKRISYTKKCLVETEKQIAQIAQEAGYANLSNFTRRFKSAENMTPGQYRSLYGKENRQDVT